MSSGQLPNLIVTIGHGRNQLARVGELKLSATQTPLRENHVSVIFEGAAFDTSALVKRGHATPAL